MMLSLNWIRFSLFPFLLFAFISTLPAQTTGEETSAFAHDRLVLKLSPAATRVPSTSFWDGEEGESMLRQVGALSIDRTFPHHVAPKDPALADLSRIFTLLLLPGIDPQEASRTLARADMIEYAEPWFLHETFYIPNDPFADTVNFKGQWYLKQIQALEAWDIHQGDTSVVIAIIDAGQSRHVDLYQNIAFNHDDPIDGIDNDGDGYVDNYEGWDFSGATFGANGDNDPFIGNAHGLWVAGVSSALTDNGIGMAGVGFRCRYLPIKASPDDSLGLIFSGYPAMVYAADQGAQIINCSWGSAVFSHFGQDVVRYATLNRKAAVIAAAGNSQTQATFYPAGFKEVISVANTTFGDTIFQGAPGYGGSTYDYTVDVSAPGWQITSCANTQNYSQVFAGTSFSAPVVSGAVGIVQSYFPDLTGFQSAQRMRVTADPIDELQAEQYRDKMGLGRINLLRALTDPLKPSIRLQSMSYRNQDGEERMGQGDTVDISLTWINHLHPSDDLQIVAELSLLHTPFITLLSNTVQAGSVAMNERWTTQAIRMVVQPFVFHDYVVSFRMSYTDSSNGYRDFEYFHVRVNPSWIDLTINQLQGSFTSEGRIGYVDYPTNKQGIGIGLLGRPSKLFEGGLLLSTASGQVSDGIRNPISRDRDFRILDPIHRELGDARADVVLRTTFDDSQAPQPIGIEVSQEVFAWDDVPRRQFLLVQYILKNTRTQPLSSLYASLFMDWDLLVGIKNRNAANFIEAARLSYTEDLLGVVEDQYAVALLTPGPFSTYAIAHPSVFEFTDLDKSLAVSTPLITSLATGGYPSGTDVMQFTSTGPFSLAPAQLDTITFAILAGLPNQLLAIRDEAERAWLCEVNDQGPNAAFMYSQTLPTSPVQFEDANPKAKSWLWDFGQGQTSQLRAPSHAFPGPGTYLVSLLVSDGYCEKRHFQEVKVSQTTDLSSALSAGVNVYPNPHAGQWSLQWDSPVQGEASFQVTDLQGRLVWSANRQKGESAASWDFQADLPTGMYVLEGRCQSQRWHLRMVVK